ncbi:MAG: MarR family transcriptional regulator, partial [Microbacteriaceae bacterium]|nr:MarR family transcriptional regulator [Microbacteriaceae bacterium]
MRVPGFELLPSLSKLLVAHTIEFDHEFEQRMPHRTTRGPASHGRGPWLVSRAMWANFLRFVPDDGVPLDAAEPLSRITNLAGMTRWRYVTVDDGVIRPTRAGSRARDLFGEIAPEVDARWRERFGPGLWESLGPVVDTSLPWAIPVVWNRPLVPGWTSPFEAPDDLGSLLARATIAMTLGLQEYSRVPPHISANALRVIADGTRIRDVAALAGISKEAAAMSVTYLLEHDLVTQSDRMLSPTDRGRRAQLGRPKLLAAVDAAWRGAHGEAAFAAAAAALAQPDDLRTALTAPVDGWRAHPPYLAQTKRLLADPV